MTTTPKISSSMKALVNKKVSKSVKFMGEDISIKKLSVAEVLEIQAKAKELSQEDASGLELLRQVIRMSVADAEDLSDEDFSSFPMDELSKLSNEIMKFSGMVAEGK